MDIDKTIQVIRDYINRPRRKHLLIKNNDLWNQLCSSIDVIEDTQLAIKSYPIKSDQAKKVNPRSGSLYLAVYGLLQALFIQQDAVQNLNQSLGYENIDFESFPKLQKIRDIRNDAIGHPTKRGKKKNFSYHYISRPTLTHQGFQMMSCTKTNPVKFKNISLTECIDNQQQDLHAILISIAEKLKQEETTHKKTFMNKKLQEIFPSINHYYFEKIYESISNPQHYPPEFGITHINLIRETINNFENALLKRNIELTTFPSIDDTYLRLNHTLSRLENYLKSLKTKKASPLNKIDATIFWENAKQNFDELIQIAREIDEDYSQIES